MSDLNSKELVYYFKQQIDKARSNPSSFAHILRNRIHRFKNQKEFIHKNMHNVAYLTEEGCSAVEEAVSFLESFHDELPKLQLSYALCEAAFFIGKQMAKQIFIDQVQKYQKTTLEQIYKQNPHFNGEINIMIQYGFRKDEEILPSLLVDDGDQLRGRRTALLNQKYRFVGIGVHEHAEYDYILLIILSENMDEGVQQCKCSLI